jgi:nucleoside-diphosphate-sugar epimerase
MKILVTGAEGYIGNKLAHALASQGHTVHALIQSPLRANPFIHPGIKFFTGELGEKQDVMIAMKDCTQVYHTAGACEHWNKLKKNFYKQNIGNTVNVLDTAIECGVKKVVYTSCCSSWSPAGNYMHSENDPRIASFDNDYDLSKHLAEKIVRDYGKKQLDAVIVNPSQVYGPAEGRINSVNPFIKILLGNTISPLPWHLDVAANYSYIDDVVNGHMLAMEKGCTGERYILGGENISYRNIIEFIKENLPGLKWFVRTPGFIFKAWAYSEQIRAKLTDYKPVLTSPSVRQFLFTKTFDCSKAINQLGYRITPFSTGIKITIDHFLQQNKENEYIHINNRRQ